MNGTALKWRNASDIVLASFKGIHTLVFWVIHVLWVIGYDPQEGGSRIFK